MRKAHQTKFRKHRASTEEELFYALPLIKEGIPGILSRSRDGLDALTWLVARLDEHHLEHKFETQTTKYKIKEINQIETPDWWHEGEEGAILNYDEVFYGYGSDDEIYGSGFWTDYMSEQMATLGISPGDLLTGNDADATSSRANDLGNLTNWTDQLQVTETLDCTGIVREALEYLERYGSSLFIRKKLDVITSNLAQKNKFASLSLELYDKLTLLDRILDNTPPLEHRLLACADLSRDLHIEFDTKRREAELRVQQETALVLMEKLRKLFFARRLQTPSSHLRCAAVHIQRVFRGRLVRTPRPARAAILPPSTLDHDRTAASTTTIATEPSPISVTSTLGSLTPAKSRFGMRSSATRALTPARMRSKPQTPPASTEDSFPGGVKKTPWITGGFDYETWASNRHQPKSQIQPTTLTSITTPTTNRHRSRGTYEQYQRSQRFARVRALAKRPRRPTGLPLSDTLAPQHRNDTPTRKRAGNSSPPAVSDVSDAPSPDEALFAFHTFPSATRLIKQSDPPSKTDADANAKPPPGDDLALRKNAKASSSDSRFELKPADHPSLSNGYGSYYEWHRDGDQREHHGYEIRGGSPKSNEYSSESEHHAPSSNSSSRSYSNSDEPDSLSDEPYSNSDEPDSNSDSDEDQSVGEEEVDPG